MVLKKPPAMAKVGQKHVLIKPNEITLSQTRFTQERCAALNIKILTLSSAHKFPDTFFKNPYASRMSNICARGRRKAIKAAVKSTIFLSFWVRHHPSTKEYTNNVHILID
jgi:hypothetical protein